MDQIMENLAFLKDAIIKSEDYKRYEAAIAEIEKYPEKKHQVMEYRVRNFELQHNTDGIDIFSETDRLEQEFYNLRKDPIVAELLSAELKMCRIYQKITMELISALDFDLDFSEALMKVYQ